MNSKEELIYDVRFKYTHEHLKQDFFDDIIKKYHSQYPEILGKIKDDYLRSVKIFEAPNRIELMDKANQVLSLIEYLCYDLDKAKDVHDVVKVIKEGQQSKDIKEYIFPKSYIENFGHTVKIIRIAVDMLNDIENKIMEMQEYVEYFLQLKKEAA